LLSAVEQHGNWAIIDQGHLHIGPENSGGNINTATAQGGNIFFVKLICEFWWCGVGKAGSTTLAAVTE
jgi:hypothetical protein